MAKQNNYSEALTKDFFDSCPKAVFAALAISFGLIQVNEDFEKIEKKLIAEWENLNLQGIIQQKVPNRFL